ncbi:MAG: tRNA (adenosine(37)-N6)-threonylcarbamoyltransferase complex dimerization subunit type 1 TsaB [Acetobacteraceae bacterium]|nr:tRNA (adenosine(37)-N6)-threonylcarbamoyltransferase complex dimerization subunit type 1 TsaB [Acetobacteraceae bacterium]
MRILTVDSAIGQCAAGAVEAQQLVAERRWTGDRDQAALLPRLVAEVLDDAGWWAESLGLVAATVGPGSFTGIRAGLSLAHGIATATCSPLIGVTVGEALAEAVRDLGPRALWVAIASRKNRIFLDRNGRVSGESLDGLPDPLGPVAVAGDAAEVVAAQLAANGADVAVVEAGVPEALAIAAVAERRFAGQLPPLPAQPLYVDQPEVHLPPSGLRPPPA